MPDPAAQGAEERCEWRIWPTHTDGTPEPVVDGPPITESLLVVPKTECLALAARLEAVEGALREIAEFEPKSVHRTTYPYPPRETPFQAVQRLAREALNPEQGER